MLDAKQKNTDRYIGAAASMRAFSLLLVAFVLGAHAAAMELRKDELVAELEARYGTISLESETETETKTKTNE